jgi:hypothetical protein
LPEHAPRLTSIPSTFRPLRATRVPPTPSSLFPSLDEFCRAAFVLLLWTAPHPRFASRCSRTSPPPSSPPKELHVVRTSSPKSPPTRCRPTVVVRISSPHLAQTPPLNAPVEEVKTSSSGRPLASHVERATAPPRAW